MSCSPRLCPGAALTLALTVLTTLGCGSPTAPTQTPNRPAPIQTPAPQPLTVSCPAAQSATSTDGNPVAVTYPAPTVAGGPAGGASAADVSCTPASGTPFAIGATEVRCTAVAGTDTASCAFSVTVAGPQPRLTRTTFLAFGDSLTAGWISESLVSQRAGAPLVRYALTPALSYPTQLRSLLDARYPTQSTELQVLNAGVGGEWAEDGAVRFPGVMSANRPQVVLLLEGINDLLALGQPGLSRASRAVDTMAKEARNRGARLFLATLPPPRPLSSHGALLPVIQSLNQEIRATARGEGAVLVDIHQALSVDITRYIGSDGLHPTAAGYQRMAETFFAAVRADLEVLR